MIDYSFSSFSYSEKEQNNQTFTQAYFHMQCHDRMCVRQLRPRSHTDFEGLTTEHYILLNSKWSFWQYFTQFPNNDDLWQDQTTQYFCMSECQIRQS